MAYLDSRGLTGDSTDVVIDDGICGKERPDRVYDFGDKIIVLECDEHRDQDRTLKNTSEANGGLEESGKKRTLRTRVRQMEVWRNLGKRGP